MHAFMIILPILLPLFAGAALPFLKDVSSRLRNAVIFGAALLNTALVWLLILFRPTEMLTLAYFTSGQTVSFFLDDLGCVFAGLVATLWPLATLYALGYMRKDPAPAQFFAYYNLAYGAVIGVAFAQNLLTMYVFYELLTLFTVPMVMHGDAREAIHAGRKYLYYSLGGSAFAFIGMIFVLVYTGTTDFIPGGVPGAMAQNATLLLIAYVLTFCGFGVKAAVVPLHGWLPTAAIAPTPVTALLHAVAVVKAGVFAIIRVTNFTFEIEMLRGSWAQYAVMALVIFSMVYASVAAVKEGHLKRRLAYSTIGNLSYILFGAVLMTPAGTAGALMHMLAHGLLKICAFFCVGMVLQRTGREYLHEMGGMGKRMPVTFLCLGAVSLGLASLPLTAGFTGKWAMGLAAVESGGTLAIIGMAALVLCAFLSAVYLFSVLVQAFWGEEKEAPAVLEKLPRSMGTATVIFAVAGVLLGLLGAPLWAWLQQAAQGMF